MHPILKHKLGVFNSILKKAIREAKISYYNMMFEKYKYDIKNTWKMISEVLIIIIIIMAETAGQCSK